jgi:hypothetical protein
VTDLATNGGPAKLDLDKQKVLPIPLCSELVIWKQAFPLRAVSSSHRRFLDLY